MTPAQKEVRRALTGKPAKVFLLENPCVWYDRLRERLGTRLAPIRLKEGLGLECKAADELEWFARDLFLRELRDEVPTGWRRGEEGISVALGAACAALAFVDQSMEEHADRAVDYLIGALFIPEGWLPESPEDPILVEAFDATR